MGGKIENSDNREKLRVEAEMESLKSDLSILTSRLRDAEAKNVQYEKDLVDYQQMKETIKEMEVLIQYASIINRVLLSHEMPM